MSCDVILLDGSVYCRPEPIKIIIYTCHFYQVVVTTLGAIKNVPFYV